VWGVADAKQPTPGPFDVVTVRELVELMDKFDLSEVDLNDGDQRIRLRRGKLMATAQPALTHANQPPPVSQPSTLPPAVVGKKLLEIKSELVGTFYAKADPTKDDYVKVGSRVTPDSVVCKVEAMKIFNEITAKVSGTVAEICVKNGDFVEFEQVLFRVDPS
jgi:acetyl-CoA carboxylase biotin carboxyl carrier protein